MSGQGNPRRMAEMSGLELQRRLNELGARIPVIMLTGHGDVPMAVEAMKAGAIDFLQKPYRKQALLYSINAALSMDADGRRSSVAADNFDQCRACLWGVRYTYYGSPWVNCIGKRDGCTGLVRSGILSTPMVNSRQTII